MKVAAKFISTSAPALSKAGNWAIGARLSNVLNRYLTSSAPISSGGEEREGGDMDKPRRVGQPMLVLDVKLVELPEGVGTEPVPSLVRLQPLDLCFGEWVDAPGHVVKFSQRLRSLGLGGVRGKDREPGSALDVVGQPPLCVRQRQLEGEVVEGASEVVETVPGDEAEAGGRRLDDLGPKELLSGLGVEFGPRSMRAFFAPGSRFRLKALQMVKRPVEPPFVVEVHEG